MQLSILGKSIPIVTLGYLSLVRLLRWRRYNTQHKKWATRKLDSITPEEAQTILHGITMWDMPGLFVYSLSFALFKTYGVPTISKILAGTKEFVDPKLVSRRYADTEILIASWVQYPIAGYYDFNEKRTSEKEKTEIDPRAMIALARVNWIHSKYSISNDDYLYTLSLFILEPIRWINRYGWRELSPLECQASFVFWKEIGIRMNIKDIPDTLDELITWSLAYEREKMVPTTTNRDVAGCTMAELLHYVPSAFGIKAFATRIAICCLEDRVRIAMMQPEQPLFLRYLTKGLLKTAGYFQRYLCLPRFRPESLVPLSPPRDPGPKPRMHPNRWTARPWYKPESGGLQGLVDTFAVMVGYYDFLPSRQFKSEGYRIEELGPIPFEQSAHEKIMDDAAVLLGCPVAGPWSLNGGR